MANAELPTPYIARQNGHLITAEDWNDIQSMGRAELFTRGARHFDAIQLGDLAEEDGVPVVRVDLDSGASWAGVAGLSVELRLEFPSLLCWSARGRASADLAAQLWVEDQGRGFDAPARVSAGLAVHGGAPDLGARPWDERGPLLASLAQGAAPKAVSGRLHFGTGAGLWLQDALVLPPGVYALSLRFAGKGSVTNGLLQLTVHPNAR